MFRCSDDDIQLASDEAVLSISNQLITQNIECYKALAE